MPRAQVGRLNETMQTAQINTAVNHGHPEASGANTAKASNPDRSQSAALDGSISSVRETKDRIDQCGLAGVRRLGATTQVTPQDVVFGFQQALKLCAHCWSGRGVRLLEIAHQQCVQLTHTAPAAPAQLLKMNRIVGHRAALRPT